ncbi:MAG: NAD(P)-binding domain-containing protein [Planctomycetes bacterium]|nr:NAD(P)-binding domain-containing protein [Planctomycetota bacterium]MBI3846120.1 NAD(P)-binding domain-containing protein [Planctomycetota bacterium]
MKLQLAIIGAGPAGLAAAFEAKRLGLTYAVIERRGIGDSISQYPIGMEFFSDLAKVRLPGMTLSKPNYRKPTREEYLAALGVYVEEHALTVRTWEEVVGIDGERGDFVVRTRRGADRLDEAELHAERVIVATGSFDRPVGFGRTTPGQELMKVIHRFHEVYPFRGKRVLVVGGGNSAVESALLLFRAGAEVAISYYGAVLSPKMVKTWLLPDITNRIRDGDVVAHLETRVEQVKPRTVVLRREAGGEFEIENDFVLLCTGTHPDDEFLRRLGLAVGSSHRPLFDAETFETESRRGIYVLGTVGSEANFIEKSRLQAPELVRRLANWR